MKKMNEETLTRKTGLQDRAFQFAVEVLQLVQSLPKDSVGQVLNKQLLRAATSIGANMEEAFAGLTRKDYIHSLNIARKEACESKY